MVFFGCENQNAIAKKIKMQYYWAMLLRHVLKMVKQKQAISMNLSVTIIILPLSVNFDDLSVRVPILSTWTMFMNNKYVTVLFINLISHQVYESLEMAAREMRVYSFCLSNMASKWKFNNITFSNDTTITVCTAGTVADFELSRAINCDL